MSENEFKNTLASKILADIQECEKHNQPYTTRAKGLLVDAALEIERLSALQAAQPNELSELLELVNEQAEDDGLWFIAETAPEAYLQHELRRLHAKIEDMEEDDENTG